MRLKQCARLKKELPFPGIHAREWSATSSTLFTIYEVVENYAAHPQYADSFNFHFIPSANPDGYEYTWADVS